MKIIIATLLLIPAAAFAGSAFDGTWKTNLESFKVTGKPDVYLLVDGVYTCASCAPELKVPADGKDHAVSGHDYYDTAMVKVTGANSIEMSLKRSGKEVGHIMESVSADGGTLTDKFTDYTGEQVVSGEVSSKRVAAGPAGSHAVSGSWQSQSLSGNDAMVTMQLRMTADGLQWSGNGQHYDAKFDGKQYPVVGDPGKTMVSLKKISDDTIEETDYRQGKVMHVYRSSVSKDGKSIMVTDEDRAHGQVVTYTLDKQP